MLGLDRSGWNAQVSPQGRPQVHESVLITGLISIRGLISNRDGLLIAIPFGLLLFVQFFRLDTLVAASPRPKRVARRFCGPDAVGDSVLTDPDGRAVSRRRSASRPKKTPPPDASIVVARDGERADRSG
jgi:hypothetical protein